MAHFGSRAVASAKVCADSLYWKECSSATPFSMVGCTSAEQVVGKFTLPSWSAGAANTVELHSEKRRAISQIAVLRSRMSLIGWSSLEKRIVPPMDDSWL